MSSALAENVSASFKKSGVRIIVVSGASGGHIFPALSLIDKLKTQAEVILLIPRKHALNREALMEYEVRYTFLTSLKLGLNFRSIVSWWNFLRGSLQSLFLLLTFKPDIVVGFGSLASIPVCFFAWFLRIETLIHEQNVSPGRANRFLAFFADKIAISFLESQKYFSRFKEKLVLTGNLLRKELIVVNKDKALEFFAFSKNKFTILVMGGSQGASSVNGAFIRAVLDSKFKEKLQIIHLAGQRDKELCAQDYRNSGLVARIFDFFTSMQYAYSASDLVVSRAGATTISELILYRIPAVIIPYPYAYEHQLENAKVLENNGSAVIVKESELGGGNLSRVLQDLISDQEKIRQMRLSYNRFNLPAARELLSKEVFSLVPSAETPGLKARG